jgi:HEPN domain-containing protein
VLVRKAEGDEAILDRLLDDPDVPDDALGFHAQQTIEKRLKAVLALHGIDFQRTHNIGYLISLLDHHKIDVPGDRGQLEELSPWAAGARYEDAFDTALDRIAVREMVSLVRDWSDRLLQAGINSGINLEETETNSDPLKPSDSG